MPHKIKIKNLEWMCSIGVHPEEKTKEQPVLINLDLYLKEGFWVAKDHLSETLDYSEMVSKIENIARSKHFHLQETLCQEVVSLCMEYTLVERVRCSVEKKDAYPHCESIGFEWDTTKEDFRSLTNERKITQPIVEELPSSTIPEAPINRMEDIKKLNEKIVMARKNGEHELVSELKAKVVKLLQLRED